MTVFSDDEPGLLQLAKYIVRAVELARKENRDIYEFYKCGSLYRIEFKAFVSWKGFLIIDKNNGDIMKIPAKELAAGTIEYHKIGCIIDGIIYRY